MADSARAMLAGDHCPYDVAVRLLGDLGPVLTTADYSGSAAYVWDFLTDGIDGPPRCARGLTEAGIESLMRQAASEWLELQPSPEILAAYVERWSDWPESVS